MPGFSAGNSMTAIKNLSDPICRALPGRRVANGAAKYSPVCHCVSQIDSTQISFISSFVGDYNLAIEPGVLPGSGPTVPNLLHSMHPVGFRDIQRPPGWVALGFLRHLIEGRTIFSKTTICRVSCATYSIIRRMEFNLLIKIRCSCNTDKNYTCA